MTMLRRFVASLQRLVGAAPSYKVKFQSTLIGTIADLDVSIQNVRVNSPNYKVDYQQTLSDDNLTVLYQISGPNGTAYTIKYTCTSNGTAKSDPDNPTDVTGAIADGGYIEVTLTIPLK